MIAWTHAVSPFVAGFTASLVEGVEAMTIVLAVGSVRGWRGALGGCTAALAVLLALIAVLGPALERIPLRVVQVGVGTLLLLFGMRWLRKAILRAGGVLALRNEGAAYERETTRLRGLPGGGGWDGVAFATSFQITMLEGVEVVFIVVAIGAGGAGLLLPAGLGALAALAAVIAVGVAVHRPLVRVPENGLKFAVGVLLSAFGTFWVGEGLGAAWPAGDWAIPALIFGFLGVAAWSVWQGRRRVRTGLP